MSKKTEQYANKAEFNTLSIKVDHMDEQFKASEARDERQQKGIEEILNILNTTKGLVSFIKTTGAITASLSAIICALYNIKNWIKQ